MVVLLIRCLSLFVAIWFSIVLGTMLVNGFKGGQGNIAAAQIAIPAAAWTVFYATFLTW